MTDTRRNTRRFMVIAAAAAATYYPTGQMLGVLDAAATTGSGAGTVTNTAGSSWFATAPRLPTSLLYGGYIIGIHVLALAAGSSVAIESHGGTVLIPAIDSTTVKSIYFGENGVPFRGGFRATTVGAPAALILIEWEEDER